MGRNIYKTYFSHDIYSRQDPKIKSMLVHFRKESNEKAQAAVCLFWWIIEDMHADDYKIEDIDVYADDYRCDVDFLKSILEDFDLFRKEDDCYISDRVLRNIAEQKEKAEKAKKSAQKRWNNKGKKPETPPEDAPQEPIDMELVNSIIQIYNKAFNKTQIVGKENRERIFKIHKENSMDIDLWQRVFENARRGWDIKGEHKKPNLQNILDKWDLFASDDYYLAPDYEKAKREKAAKEKAIAEQRAKEEQARAQEIKEQNEDKAKICDAQTAIEYILKWFKGFPDAYIVNSKIIRDYANQYDFTVNELLGIRASREKEV